MVNLDVRADLLLKKSLVLDSLLNFLLNTGYYSLEYDSQSPGSLLLYFDQHFDI